MTARAVIRDPIDWAFVRRAAIPIVVIGVLLTTFVFGVRWSWSGFDLGVYLEAGRRLAAGQDPYAFTQPPIDAMYRYSPEFAAAMAGLSALPYSVVAVGWRLLAVGLLALSVRGLGWRGVLILVNPLIVLDLAVGNVATIMLAAMIAVVRWPTARTLTAYALLVIVIPKPTLLPVLAWGLWTIHPARMPVTVMLAVGMVTLLYPEFGSGLLSGSHIFGMTQTLNFVPASLVWAALATGGLLTILSIRLPRLLGCAAVLVTPYYFNYGWIPLLLILVPVGSSPELEELDVDPVGVTLRHAKRAPVARRDRVVESMDLEDRGVRNAPLESGRPVRVIGRILELAPQHRVAAVAIADDEPRDLFG